MLCCTSYVGSSGLPLGGALRTTTGETLTGADGLGMLCNGSLQAMVSSVRWEPWRNMAEAPKLITAAVVYVDVGLRAVPWELANWTLLFATRSSLRNGNHVSALAVRL